MSNHHRTVHLQPFQTHFLIKNPHIQTILPKFIKQKQPHYQRILKADSTGLAQVAYDFVYADGTQPSLEQSLQRPLAVMFHGLEGDSDSHYAKCFVNEANAQGWDAVIVHYRGCGGVANPSPFDYNAGDTKELHHVLQQLKQQYQDVYAAGVSLGGNMLARYMGEYQDDVLCKAAVVVSAPVDLTTSAKAMHRFVAKRIYTPYLLKPLLVKALQKIDDPQVLAQLKQAKTLDIFDDLYTAPRHGYGTGKDYYLKASALPVMKNIRKPTLVITAIDDPFLGKIAQAQDVSEYVQLLYSPNGGHVGFMQYQNKRLNTDWLPQTIFRYFNAIKSS
ncbi:YheT family hydrolase [Acinetobacter sp. c1-l78]|uniref:YheT family hydrolase n=1 Tax=Acinetobacter sp. c1-l78 TaxID=3342803 RepID=UPI0035BB7FBC